MRGKRASTRRRSDTAPPHPPSTHTHSLPPNQILVYFFVPETKASHPTGPAAAAADVAAALLLPLLLPAAPAPAWLPPMPPPHPPTHPPPTHPPTPLPTPLARTRTPQGVPIEQVQRKFAHHWFWSKVMGPAAVTQVWDACGRMHAGACNQLTGRFDGGGGGAWPPLQPTLSTRIPPHSHHTPPSAHTQTHTHNTQIDERHATRTATREAAKLEGAGGGGGAAPAPAAAAGPKVTKI